MQIRKAVIPAAGFGTRFLPATKALPKEMLPIVDKPVIQYIVEEAVASGITDIVLVIGRSKRAVEEHFDHQVELEHRLEERGDTASLDMLRRISGMASIHFVWQKNLLGLGDAVYQARHHINGEPFAVLLGDTVAYGPRPVTAQLMDVYAHYGSAVVGVEEIAREEVSRFGVVGGDAISERTWKIGQLVEKPSVEDAPSSLIIAGRYILPPEIFEALERTPRGAGNEVQLTDAIGVLMEDREGIAYRFEGRRFDIGNPLDFIKTNIHFALQREEFRSELADFMRSPD